MKITALSLLLSLVVLRAVQGGRKCTNPKGNDGESYTEGCLKKTCKAGVWRSSLDATLCCYNGQPYLPKTIITATEDGSATASLYCKQEDDVATAVLQVENTCGPHSTKEQVQEIKHLLVEYLKHTDCDKDSPVTTSTTSTSTTPPHGTEGILVSGGYGEYYGNLKSVELFIPETGKTCSFPDLPGYKYGHTMNMVGDDLVVCGGRNADWARLTKSCLQLSPPPSSAWTSYATTRRERYFHTAWVSPSGELLLVGGDYSQGDAEIVSAGTSTAREMRLQQDTWGHCGIDSKDSTILTGGTGSMSIVTRYNLQGHVENLPELNQGRNGHGCSSYMSDGTMILIVAGGRDGEREVLSSVERMTTGASGWTTVNALPKALYDVRAITVANLVYMTGGMDEDDVARSEILVLDGEDWREVGQLQEAKAAHATTRIDTASFMEFCN